jgi:hypothetical protein
LGLHPSGEPKPSPAFRGALGDSGRKKRARNGEEISRASCGPDLSAREGSRRPHRLVFRAPSSSAHRRILSAEFEYITNSAYLCKIPPYIYKYLYKDHQCASSVQR